MADKMIDVSTWHGNINWNAVKSSGVKAAIIRAGFGSHMSQKDKKFDQNYTNAKAAGMPIGAYWYSYATSVSDAKSEAATCIEVLKGKQFEYPIYYDLEDPSMTKCGKTVLTQIAVAFCEALEAAGYFVGIYANPNWLKNFLNYGTVKKYTLWLAHWGVSEPGYPCDVWQYSSSGSVSGISGRVDLDWGYRDFATTIKDGGFNGFSKETTNSSTSNTTSSDGFKVGDIVKVKVIKIDKDTKEVSEYVLHQIILENIDSFLKELGVGFAYIGSEAKIKMGDKYNYIDFLLFNVKYNCYVVVELKVTEMKHYYIGQIMNYVNYVDKHIKEPFNDKTIGIVICKKENEFVMEYCTDPRIFTTTYELERSI